jgi:hypothetical protein
LTSEMFRAGGGEQCQAMPDCVVELNRAACAAAKEDKAKSEKRLSFPSWMVRRGGSGELSGFLKRAEACAGTGAIVLWRRSFILFHLKNQVVESSLLRSS